MSTRGYVRLRIAVWMGERIGSEHLFLRSGSIRFAPVGIDGCSFVGSVSKHFKENSEMLFNTSVILAQAVPPQMSYLGWMVSALSTASSLLVLISAGLIFLGAYYLVSKRRPASTLAPYLILLPLPVIISFCGWIWGSIKSLATIASLPELTTTNQDIAGGLASSLLSLMFAILVSSPTYLILAYGLLSREFRPSTPAPSLA